MTTNSQYNYNQPRTIEDALRVFGYSKKDLSQLTKEIIQKEFRKKVKETHPDFHPENKEKQLKYAEITIAWDILKNYFDRQKKYENKRNEEIRLEEYILKQIERLKERIKEDGPNTEMPDYVILRKKIEKNIYELETDSIYYTSKNQFDRDYEQAKRQIKLEMEKFQLEFYKNNYIDEREVEIIIDYNTSIISFYNQLLTIKSKYSKEEKVKKILENEIEEYKTYIEYEHLKTLIDNCVQNALTNIKKNNFQNYQEEVTKMHQQIRQEVFEKYYELKKKITKLESTISGIKEKSIEEEYSKMRKNFEEGKSFIDIENMIENLEKEISEYNEKELQKQKQKELEDTIVKIYQSIIKKYSEALKQHNVVTEINKINQIQEKLNQILQIFTSGLENKQDSIFFNQLEEITFTDETKDKEIIDNALKILNPNKNNVYIKREGDLKLDQSCFFYFDEESMMIYKVHKTVTRATVITKEELEKEYISLEEVLKSSQQINKFKKLGNELVRGIYQSKTHIIYFCKNQFNITTNSIFDKFEKTSFYDALEMFDDKKQVLEMIKKQTKRKVEEYKKTSILRNVKFLPFQQKQPPRVNNIKYPKYEKNDSQDTWGEKEEIFKKKYTKKY